MKELQPIVVALGGVISAMYLVLKGNLFAVFQVVSALVPLKDVNYSNVVADLAACSPEDRATLEAAFDSAIVIADPVVQQKVVDSADALEKSVEVCYEAYGVYQNGLAVVTKVKSILGV